MDNLELIKNQKGFTFIDTLVGLSMMVIMSGVLVSTANAANNIFNVQNITRKLSHDGMQAIRYVADEIAQTNPIATDGQLEITDGTDYDEVKFRIPVDWDEDGDVILDGTYDEFEWGAWDVIVKNNGKTATKIFKNNWIRYRVVQQNSNKILRREVLKENGSARGSKYRKQIAHNVQSFQVEKDGSLITISITFEESDLIGQSGKSRDYSQSYVLSTQTLLRNTVGQDSGDSGNGDDPDE